MSLLLFLQINISPIFYRWIRILHPMPTCIIQIIVRSMLRRIQYPMLPAMNGLAESRSVKVPLHSAADISYAEGESNQVLFPVQRSARMAGRQVIALEEFGPFVGKRFSEEVPCFVPQLIRECFSAAVVCRENFMEILCERYCATMGGE